MTVKEWWISILHKSDTFRVLFLKVAANMTFKSCHTLDSERDLVHKLALFFER